MKISSRKKMTFSWAEAVRIAGHIRKMDGLGDTRRELYAALIFF